MIFEEWERSFRQEISTLKDVNLLTLKKAFLNSKEYFDKINLSNLEHYNLKKFYEYDEFSDENYLLFDCENYVVLLHINGKRGSSIHRHEFKGYFTCLIGSVYESKYDFESQRRSTCGELEFGKLLLIEDGISASDFLEIGNDIHKVHYDADFNVTLCIREKEDHGFSAIYEEDRLIRFNPLSLTRWNKIKEEIYVDDLSSLNDLTLGQIIHLEAMPKPQDDEQALYLWIKMQKVIKKRISNVKWS